MFEFVDSRTLPVHANERLVERYDVKLSKERQKKLYGQLQKGKNTIRLTQSRFVVYFDSNWYLLTRSANGTITTFLPREAVTPEEKVMLCNDETYRRVNKDQFQAGIAAFPLVKPVRKDRKKFRNPKIDDSELPPDFESAEKLLRGFALD